MLRNSPLPVAQKNPTFSSTPVGQERPPRISFACSQIADDSAMDIFSNSMMEMSLDDCNDLANNPTTANHTNEDIFDDKIEDLEASLSKIIHDSSIVEDSFDKSVELIKRGNTQKPRIATEDSFDTPLSQVLLPKTQRPAIIKDVLSLHESRVIHNESIDIFDNSFEISTKRPRSSLGYRSPSVASPLPKASRPSRNSSFYIEDVCRTESTWNAFVTKAFLWEEASISLLLSRTTISAIAFCADNEMPIFIPLSDDDFAGSSAEEINYPSYTPCQNIPIESRLSCIKRILESCTIYSFNALFNCGVLRDLLKIQMNKPVCVEYLSFLAHYQSDEKTLCLESLASRFDWTFNIQDLLNMSARIKTAVQAYICSRIHSRLKRDAIAQSSEESVELEISAVQVIAHISSVGFPFALNLCSDIVAKITKRIEALEECCYKLAGKEFNLESPAIVSEVLFGNSTSKGLISGKRHPSTNKTVLTQIKSLHPIIPKIIEFRQLKHIISHCIRPLQDYVCSDGVIRSSFDICTATGRVLSNKPNVQTVSKSEIIENFSARSLFATKTGRMFVAADYSQLELRVLAHLSADPFLIKKLSTIEGDIFTELSKEWGFSRDSVKQLCYGLIYGMGVKSLADETKITIDKAQELLDSFFRSFPKVKSYINAVKKQSETVGYVTTFLNRRRVACTKGKQEDRSRDYRQSINFTIQGTASEIFKKAIIKIHEQLKGVDANIVMIIHDEVIIECSKDVVPVVSSILRRQMENVFRNFRVPLTVKVKIGYDWHHLK